MFDITDEWGQRGVLRARCPRSGPAHTPIACAARRRSSTRQPPHMLLDAFGQPPRWSLTLTPSASQVMVVWKVLFTAVLVSSCTVSAARRRDWDTLPLRPGWGSSGSCGSCGCCGCCCYRSVCLCRSLVRGVALAVVLAVASRSTSGQDCGPPFAPATPVAGHARGCAACALGGRTFRRRVGRSASASRLRYAWG